MYRESAIATLKDANRMLRATTRWLTWCDGLNAAMKAAGVYAPTVYPRDLAIEVERTYMAANKRPSMPSKAHKHRMYGEVYRAASLADVEVAPGSIQDLAGISEVLTRVTAALATA
jgi:hypothetical protein